MKPTCLVFAYLFVLGTYPLGATSATEVDFNRDIKPILSNRCFFCHGPDEEERQGGTDGLRLDTRDGAMADLGGHAAVVAGDVASSGLIERIVSSDPDTVMPPPDHGQRLSDREVELIKQWIEDGAEYAEHWSYVRPVRPPLPSVNAKQWPRNEIDHFLLAHLEKSGLTPSPEADKATLIRRLSLDLIGLPPTIAEVDAFVSDDSPSAYENLVDRLMSQKAYGEHWAKHWLDLARYADSAGYADDPSRTIWLYRDYVIQSINANKPFDQFTIEQIAGDLLPGATEEQIIATAFHRNTLTNNEGGTNDEEFRNAAIVDRVNTTLAVWMGTTMACAQCHTHKYDPITQEEYFKVFAILNNTEDADRGDESPLLPVLTDSQKQQRDTWQSELSTLKKTLETPTPELRESQTQWETDFPKDLSWQPVQPVEVISQAGSEVILNGDDVVVLGGAKVDTYELKIPVEGSLRAVRLEALTDPTLPNSGPGHANGNFVITGIKAKLTPAVESPISGRYVRVEIMGRDKILSLAEVQVFHSEQNVALTGKATQSSTGFEGPANLGIDGNTDGDYARAKSTTHTQISNDPWWELDLNSVQSIDRLAIWNRTDANNGERLNHFRVSILDETRKTVWQENVAEVPNPRREWFVDGARSLTFTKAFADFSQPDFDASHVLENRGSTNKGWAIAGKQGQPHQLVLMTDEAVNATPQTTLTLTIEQQSQYPEHTLGHFRISVTSDERIDRWAQTTPSVIEALTIATAERTTEQQQIIDEHYRSIAPSLAPARARMAEIEKSLAELKPVTVPVLRELSEGKHRKTQIQVRGNFMNLGDEVQPGTPAAFPPLPKDRPADRLALAQWLVDESNPLTTRVLANRYWEKIFGTGLVSTSEDFGSQGALPSNPELLDWLATEWVRLKWDTKAFVKQLVMSAAYRQSSAVDSESFERDPDNQWVARGPRLRLTAESIRDQALAISGLLSNKSFGPPVNPPQPSIGLSAAFGGGIDWNTSTGEDKYRRALYTTWRRSNPYPSMATFDAPNREVCTLRRSRSNTPLQALVTLNDPVYMEAAQGLARRIVLECAEPTENRLTYGFRLCLAREPKPEEVKLLAELYTSARQDLSARPDDAMKLATDPLGPLPESVDAIDLAAWTTVANVLLNLDETLMPR